jgi:hypothetical protein
LTPAAQPSNAATTASSRGFAAIRSDATQAERFHDLERRLEINGEAL